MTNIRDFEPGTEEQRGAIHVKRYDGAPAGPFHYEHDEVYRFGIPVTATIDDAPTNEIWIRVAAKAVRGYHEDDNILSIVATELLSMAANSDPNATLADGRKLADLKPEDLYR